MKRSQAEGFTCIRRTPVWVKGNERRLKGRGSCYPIGATWVLR